MIPHLQDSDFVYVAPETLAEMREKASRAPFIHNGMIRPSRDAGQIDVGDEVAFPWKNAIERLAEIGESVEDEE